MNQEDREKSTRGRYVEVFGLESEKGKLMNGQRGIVIKQNGATGRIEVSLGSEARLTSLKPENLNLVTGAPVAEVVNATDIAFPHLKAALEEEQEQFQPRKDEPVPPPAAALPPQDERDRSWSPPPEIRKAASDAALTATSVASARGCTPEQAEAYGAAAAERTIYFAREAFKVQAAAASPADMPSKTVSSLTSSGTIPGATKEREALQSVDEAQIGDTLEAFGLKSADAEVNNERGVIQNILGWSNRKRYVMRFKVFVIDDNGDLGEKEKTITLTSRNLRIPGSGLPATEENFKTAGKMRRSGRLKSNGKTSSTRSRSRRRRHRSCRRRRSRSRRR